MGFQAHNQPNNMGMQLCSGLQVVVHQSTAAECEAFANTRAGETEGVSTQVANTAMTSASTGYCVYNSGGSGTWQLVTTTVDTIVCDTPGSLCACQPRDDYVTLGTSAAMSSVQLYYDTDHNGATYTPQLCCELCAMEAPPSAPPSPPKGQIIMLSMGKYFAIWYTNTCFDFYAFRLLGDNTVRLYQGNLHFL